MKTEIYLTIAGSLIVGLSWTVFVLMVTLRHLERKIEQQKATIMTLLKRKPTIWDLFSSIFHAKK